MCSLSSEIFDSFTSLCLFSSSSSSFLLACTATWPCHCTTNIGGRRKREALNLGMRAREDSRFKTKMSLDRSIRHTYKIRSWRNAFRSSLRIIDRLLNCNSLNVRMRSIEWVRHRSSRAVRVLKRLYHQSLHEPLLSFHRWEIIHSIRHFSAD